MQAVTQGRTPAAGRYLAVPGQTHNTGRNRRVGRTDKRGEAASPVRSPLCAFLSTRLLPSVEVSAAERTGITAEEYRELYTKTQNDALLSGLPALGHGPLDDPEEGLALLVSHFREHDSSVRLYVDEDAGECGLRRFSLVREQELSDGYHTFVLPLRHTYERMRPELGLLVRRFIRAFVDHGGVTGDDEGPMAYMEEWIRDWASGEMMEMDEEEEREARYALSEYSDEPGTPGAKLGDFRSLQPLTPEELRAFTPGDEKERRLLDFLLEGERFIAGDCLDCLEYAEYRDQRYLDDNIDFYIMEDLYFGVVWDGEDDDPVMKRFVDSINNDFECGADAQRLILREEVGTVGRQDVGSHPVKLFLNYWEDLAWRLASFRNK